MKIEYVNSNGKKIDLTGDDYKMLRSTDLFDYEWTPSTKNEYNPEVYAFTRSMIEKSMQISIMAKNRKEYNTLCNKLLEVFETDVYNVKKGQIVVNDDYFYPCYITAKSITSWNPSSNRIVNTFKIVSEKGKWFKEVEKTFGIAMDNEEYEDVSFYPRKYPFGYATPAQSNILASDAFVPFDFEITFQGAINNPFVVAGGNTYKVYTNLGEGDVLKINSKDKTIIKTTQGGLVTNEFNQRDRDNYIFEKIPATDGSTRIQANKDVVVTIKAFVERSEPKWI